jgi:hypothetical protein
MEVRICKTITSPVVLNVVLYFQEKHKLLVYGGKKRCPRRYLNPKKAKHGSDLGHCITSNFAMFTSHIALLTEIDVGRKDALST